jgi:hypothetical protein
MRGLWAGIRRRDGFALALLALHGRSGGSVCRGRSGEGFGNRVWNRSQVLGTGMLSLFHAEAALIFGVACVAGRVTGFNTLIANLPARLLNVALIGRK